MDFDALPVRFFGSDDLDAVPGGRLVDGVQALRVQFGQERGGGRRFALWCLMHMLGVAPDLEGAFEDEADRDAARDFMEVVEREMEEG